MDKVPTVTPMNEFLDGLREEIKLAPKLYFQFEKLQAELELAREMYPTEMWFVRTSLEAVKEICNG